MAAASRSPRVVREAAAAGCADANTTFVQADPATFRALVQKLTGAPGGEEKQRQLEEAVTTVAQQQHAPPPPRRPKLQERRRAAPARLELARPHPSASASSFYFYHHHRGHGLMHSPVSPMDAYVLASSSSTPSPLSSSSSMTPSPHSSPSCGGVVVISKEEEEREEKAIASKGFYLHASPRGAAAGDGERPKLLPLFPVHSPRSAAYYHAS